jgi:hypothetical protein
VAARGHFEVFPVLADAGHGSRRRRGPAEGERLEGPTGEWQWGFVDEEGNRRAISEETFPNAEAAKADAGAFVLAVRTATYGQRFAEEIADSVRRWEP